MATTTTTRYTVRKSTVAGWEVVDADGTVVTVVKNRDQARDAKRDLEANPVDVRIVEEVEPDEADELTADELAEVEEQADQGDGFEWDDTMDEHDATPVTGEQVRTSPVFAGLSDQARETIARGADAKVEEETATEAKPAKAPKARKPKAPKAAKAPKVDAEPKPAFTGEQTVTRKLEAGQLIQLRGVGVVKIVGRVKLDGQKFEVEYERVADGEYGSVALWANSRFRLVAETA